MNPVIPRRTRCLLAASIALALTGAATHVAALDRSGAAAYVQGGQNILNGHETHTLFVGAMVPWGEERPWGGSVFSTYWDVYVGQLKGPQSNGVDKSYTQVGALSVARWRYDEGHSAWFTDAGLGLAYFDDLYTRPGDRRFSTRLNFALRLGVGRSFGASDAHEVSVNYQHFSNAGIRRPNPGDDFIQLRYAYRF